MIADIRKAMNSVLAAGFTNWNTNAYLVSNVEPPMFDIKTEKIDYDLAMAGGNWLPRFQIRALVAWSDAISAQQQLDSLLEQGSSSVKAVLEADKTLGGTVSSLRVVEASQPTVFMGSGGADTIGIEFTVEVTPNDA